MIPFLNFAVLGGIRKHYSTGSLFVHYYLIKKKKVSERELTTFPSVLART